MAERRVLVDVSRLVWRYWRGGMPTGIDRVCQAYVSRFRRHSQAVIQGKGAYHILTPKHSDLLFQLFDSGPAAFRRKFLRLSATAFPASRGTVPDENSLYLNIGHTGLNEPSLPRWIARNHLRGVYLVHDLIPLLHPEYCRFGEEAKHRRRVENILRSAHGLIGNSQATIDDLAFFAAAQGLPMPPAVAAWIAGSPLPPAVAAKSFDKPHFITVGTIEGRKNHSLLLHIWKKLVRSYGLDAPLLVIVGQRGWEAGHALAMLDRAVDLKDHVLEMGACDDHTLAGLIAGARALLMPSFAEGFGLPVAEALQLGTPVIASDLPVFREFAGSIPTYLDPLDGAGWRSAIINFTGDSHERERQLQSMGDYKPPDWDGHFDRVQRWLATIGCTLPEI